MRVVLALNLASLLAVAIAGPSAPASAQFTVEQQEALRPLQQRWDRLPEYQRTRLLGAAKHYAELSSKKQESVRKKAHGVDDFELGATGPSPGPMPRLPPYTESGTSRAQQTMA